MNPRTLERQRVPIDAPALLEEMPAAAAAPAFGSAFREPEHESLVAEYMRTLKRHRRLILLCAVAGAALALLAGIGETPLYRTRTSLEIKNLNTDFMDIRSVAPTGADASSSEGDINLQTQIKLLESDTLAHEVEQRLLAEPHPQFIPREDLVSRVERLLHLPTRPPIAYGVLLGNASQNVKVKPLGVTRLVEITCDSYSAAFAAKYCNTLTSTYQDEDLQARSAEAEKTSAWLTRQVADVRQRAQDLQAKLEVAVGGNGLMLSNTVETPGEGRLKSLEDELVKAQADRMAKEADASLASSNSAATLPSVQDNPQYRALQIKLADLQTQVAALVPPLTEENPKVIHLRSQIRDVQADMATTERTSTRRQSNEYTSAVHREQMLQDALTAQQSTVSADLQKQSQVSLLRKELDSEQQLYETLLQRAKEAGFASALQAATIRVVDAAMVPRMPYSPRRVIAAAGGLAVGCLVGFGLAFYRERNVKVFRMPGDVERLLRVPELGVIPASRRPARLLASARSSDAKLLSVGAEAQARSKTIEARPNPITLAGWNERFSIAAEAYRNATLSILLSDPTRRRRSYVISSPSAGEGKTTVVSNLGVALSKSKLRVALVDGDLRRPNLHRSFGISNARGMRDILRGDLDLDKAPTEAFVVPTVHPNIVIIPAGEGTEDSVELLHSPQLGKLLARLQRDFDVVLIDAPPILHMADARILAGQADGAILILRAGQTTREQALTASNLLDQDGNRLIGTILNDFDPVREGERNFYASYYRYQKQHEPAEKVA